MSHGRHAYNRAKRRGGFAGRGHMSKEEREFWKWVDRNQRENANDADELEEEINDEWFGEEDNHR